MSKWRCLLQPIPFSLVYWKVIDIRFGNPPYSLFMYVFLLFANRRKSWTGESSKLCSIFSLYLLSDSRALLSLGLNSTLFSRILIVLPSLRWPLVTILFTLEDDIIYFIFNYTWKQNSWKPYNKSGEVASTQVAISPLSKEPIFVLPTTSFITFKKMLRTNFGQAIRHWKLPPILLVTH